MSAEKAQDAALPLRIERFFERAAPWILGLLVIAFAFFAFQRRWANDDCYITFRYAQNIAEGAGFVWNVTDPVPVEGSTSMAWTLVNAAVIAARQHPTIVSQMLGLLSGMLLLPLLYVAARRLAGLPPHWALVAPALLFAHRQFVYWSVSAMETRTAALVIFAATALMAREVTRKTTRGWWSGLLFFGATLLRPEAPLFHLAAGVGLFAVRRDFGRFRNVAISGGVHGLLLGALCLFRMSYFGQPLPNTFYVKVDGAQWARGWEFLAEFVAHYHGALWLPLMLAVLVLIVRRGVPILSAALMQVVFGVVWIAASGGGRWEFRFVDALLPAWALLIAGALQALVLRYDTQTPPPAPRRFALVGLVAVALVASQASTLERATLHEDYHRGAEMMSFEELDNAVDAMLFDGTQLRRVLRPTDRIAIGWAGAVPYMTRAWHFDPWGLNHPDARNWPFRESGVIFHQRHATWDMLAEAEVFAVDIFNQFLYPQPFRPEQLLGKLRPWAEPGVLVHCLQLPTVEGRRPLYWIFASPRPLEEVEEFARDRGLTRRYSVPLRTPRSATIGPADE